MTTHPLVEAVARAIALADDGFAGAARAAIKTVLEYEPSEPEWAGLARDLIMWRGFQRPTGAALYVHLRYMGTPIPPWLADEIPDVDHVPPKGTVAVCIHRAINAAILREIEEE